MHTYPHFAHIRGRRATRGFTLIEMVVAMIILALILSAVGAMLFSLINRRAFIEEMLRTEAIGPTLLNLITEDLEAVFVFNLDQLAETDHEGEEAQAGGGAVASDQIDFFVGTSQAGRGINARDELHFVTSNASKLRIGNTQSDIAEVGYFLRENENRVGNYVLYRREDFHIDREPTRGGKAIRLFDRVVGLEFQYFARPESDGEQESPEEFDDWDHTQQGRLPLAVRVTIWIDMREGPQSREPERHEIRRFQTMVQLPDFPSAEELAELRERLDDGGGGDSNGEDEAE